MIAAVATAGYMGYTAYESATMTDAERFMLANIEALTIDESGYDNWIETDTSCKKCNNDVQSCLWSVEGNGGPCTPDKCSECGTNGSYFY